MIWPTSLLASGLRRGTNCSLSLENISRISCSHQEAIPWLFSWRILADTMWRVVSNHAVYEGTILKHSKYYFFYKQKASQETPPTFFHFFVVLVLKLFIIIIFSQFNVNICHKLKINWQDLTKLEYTGKKLPKSQGALRFWQTGLPGNAGAAGNIM